MVCVRGNFVRNFLAVVFFCSSFYSPSQLSQPIFSPFCRLSESFFALCSLPLEAEERGGVQPNRTQQKREGLFQVPINWLFCLSRKWGGGGGWGGRRYSVVGSKHCCKPATPSGSGSSFLPQCGPGSGSAWIRLPGSGLRLDFADHNKLDFDMNH
jgi:hypothetical protein